MPISSTTKIVDIFIQNLEGSFKVSLTVTRIYSVNGLAPSWDNMYLNRRWGISKNSLLWKSTNMQWNGFNIKKSLFVVSSVTIVIVMELGIISPWMWDTKYLKISRHHSLHYVSQLRWVSMFSDPLTMKWAPVSLDRRGSSKYLPQNTAHLSVSVKFFPQKPLDEISTEFKQRLISLNLTFYFCSVVFLACTNPWFEKPEC